MSRESAWNEHIPFAGWIVEAAEPRTIVELGTHAGVSYFAFCEAVRELGMGTKCFAVDHWKGDEHAGFYGEEIFEAVRVLNEEHFAAFSHLVRSSFDDALDQFEDRSIDLLHIDGLHTYEAVKHDVESWWPKLSNQGVLLLHDTNEHRGDFGVYRVLSELSQDCPVFEFQHGHGLGVVAVGSDPPQLVAALTSLRGEQRDAVRDLYQALGRRFAQEIELEQLNSKLTTTHEALEQTKRGLTRAEATTQQLEKEADRLQGRHLQATADLAVSRSMMAQAREAESIAVARQKSLQAIAAEAKADLKRSQVALKQERRAREQLSRKLARLRNRRVVRAALSLASLARPLFRWRRRGAGKPRADLRQGPAQMEDEQISPKEPKADAPIIVERKPRTAREVEADARLVERLHASTQAGLLLGDPQPVDVVVPIYNAPDSLRRCLAALERNTNGSGRLVLVDDSSTDPLVSEILDSYRSRQNVEVIRNEENLGFTRSVNRGLDASRSNVVILNSDVEVVPGWLDRLRVVAQLNPAAATITAVSNNAGAFSVPEIGFANSTPDRLARDQVGRLIRSQVGYQTAKAPTGNGFCMFMSRKALDELGYFDEDAFPRGYGEENDWCMRALQSGWEHLVDGSVFVFHERSASFGEEKHVLMERGREVIDRRYPEYTKLVRDFVSSPQLESIRTSVAQAFDLATNAPVDPRPRLLYVLHAGYGGTSATNSEVMEELEGRYESYLLTSDGNSLVLGRMSSGEIENLTSWRLDEPITPLHEQHEEYRSIVAGILIELGIELVHVRHLIGHSFDLPALARALGIPVVLSFHDYYFICPTVHLLDNRDRFCGGICTPGQGNCRIPTSWLSSVPHLKHSWVNEWQKRVRRLFEDVDVFVTASDTAHSVYVGSYPELAEADFRVIEHGRSFAEWTAVGVAPEISANRVKIVVPGNLTVHKGSSYIRALKENDPHGLLEFHFLGSVPGSLHHLGIHHGSYSRENLAQRLAEIRPSMVGVLSVTAETYSHVVSEAWGAGIPVLVTDLGAPAERVEKHGGGWVIPHDNATEAVSLIRDIATSPDEWSQQCDRASIASIRTLAEMTSDYASLYEELWSRRRTFGPGTLPFHTSLAVVGHKGEHPASAYVRCLTRWTHPELRRKTITSPLDVEHFVKKEPSQRPALVYVQRTAIPGHLVDPFIEKCQGMSSALVVDLDDDLLNLRPDSPAYDDYRDQLEPIRRLVGAADLVTVSTQPLADSLTGLARRVEIVPNRLDERLWERPLAPPPLDDQPFRVLYYGTRTHSEDLAILQPVVDQLGADRMQLYVIGVEEPNASQAWYRRIDVPPRASRYPAFVAWLHEIKGQFNAAVVPLVDNPFNQSKSDLKYLETAALGLPGVFSDVLPYNKSVRAGVSGLLTANTTDGWVGALSRLAADQDLRNQIREAAFIKAMEEGLMRSQIADYGKTMEMLVSRNKGSWV